MKAYVFVDAENHFLRSTAVMRRIGGSNAAEALSLTQLLVPRIVGFPEEIEHRRFGYDPELQLFWDCHVLSTCGILGRLSATIHRAVYACSCAGDDDKAHQMRVKLRSYGSAPTVVPERKDIRRRRESRREEHGLIDKPKGCDFALATRMVADAAADLFKMSLLFTSDADFLPAVEAVRRMGKIVYVLGSQSALPERSPYLHVPVYFVDLDAGLENTWQNNKGAIEQSLAKLREMGEGAGGVGLEGNQA